MQSSLPSLPQEGLPLEQQVARLQALLEATRQVHSTIRPSEVLLQAARILVRELEMEGAVFLDPTGEPLISYGTIPPAPYAGCLSFPLFSKERQILSELMVAAPHGESFSFYEQDFVEGLVLQTAVALENATLHERDLEWARVQQDLDAARAIQTSLLPKVMPAIPRFSIAGKSTTCYEVGGDYLDSMSLPDGTHLMVVADVAGKGLASAIVATSFRSALRSLASQPLTLDQLAARIGQQHWEEGVEAQRRYVTAVLLRLYPDRGEVELVNAGHNPAALVKPDGTISVVSASGTPLGMLPGMQYEKVTLPFPSGSRILVYTDGLTECFLGDQEFGEERLMHTFREAASSDAHHLLEHLWNTIGSYCHFAPQSDDMTALAICHLHPSPEELTQQ
jgi:phosphoserine phosphatase RsbU/P